MMIVFTFRFAGAFKDDDITHVEGDIDPVRDMAIIFEELRLKDVEYLEARVQDLDKKVTRGGDKKMKPEFVSHQMRQEKKKRLFDCPQPTDPPNCRFDQKGFYYYYYY